MGNSRPSTSPSAGRADAAPALRRHDASLYIVASGLGGLGLGIALFYLNFLYRSLGFDARAIGVLGGAQALGALAGALPAALLPRRMPRRNAILIGGCVTGLGVVAILTQTALVALFVGAALTGFGGIIVASSGSALVADATTGLDRPRMFGNQIALGALASFAAIVIAGALLRGRLGAPRLPPILASVLPVLASLPFALLAAFAGQPLLAWAALALRAAFTYGWTPNFTALELSSFAPVERAGAVAAFTIAWNGASAAGAALSGVVRAELGADGYTANLVTLVGSYLLAAVLLIVFFRAHRPRGDAAAMLPADSAR